MSISLVFPPSNISPIINVIVSISTVRKHFIFLMKNNLIAINVAVWRI